MFKMKNSSGSLYYLQGQRPLLNMARRQQVLILQLRISEEELKSIINPFADQSPPRQRTTLERVSHPEVGKPSNIKSRADSQEGLLCGWCTLPIQGTPFGIPVSRDPKTGEYRTTHTFHHPRCATAGAKYHYSHKIDAVMKLVKELYGHDITPADEKEVMARFTRGGISDEEYENRLKDGNHLSKMIYPPMISPLTAELFNMDLRG
jgi:hypothetical protein